MKPIISKANINDLDELSVLFDQYRMFYSMKSNIDSCREFLSERLSKKDSIIYLASLNNKPTGFIQIYPSYSSVAMKPIWILNDLFIGDSDRKLGCARLLMKHVETEAVKQNIYSIKLATAIDNRAAQNLYHSVGYKKISQFENYSFTPGARPRSIT